MYYVGPWPRDFWSMAMGLSGVGPPSPPIIIHASQFLFSIDMFYYSQFSELLEPLVQKLRAALMALMVTSLSEVRAADRHAATCDLIKRETGKLVEAVASIRPIPNIPLHVRPEPDGQFLTVEQDYHLRHCIDTQGFEAMPGAVLKVEGMLLVCTDCKGKGHRGFTIQCKLKLKMLDLLQKLKFKNHCQYLIIIFLIFSW